MKYVSIFVLLFCGILVTSVSSATTTDLEYIYQQEKGNIDINENMYILGCSIETRTYNTSEGKYKICKDRDGYTVKIPGGNEVHYGTGYSWSDVQKKHGLMGKKYTQRLGQCNC